MFLLSREGIDQLYAWSRPHLEESLRPPSNSGAPCVAASEDWVPSQLPWAVPVPHACSVRAIPLRFFAGILSLPLVPPIAGV